jgi:hypothetical protein
MLLGIGKTDSNGNFYASFPVDEELPLGQHTLQVNGITASGESSSISLPVVVVESPEVAQSNAMPGSPQGDESSNYFGISGYLIWFFWLLLLLIIAWAIRREYVAGKKRRKKTS